MDEPSETLNSVAFRGQQRLNRFCGEMNWFLKTVSNFPCLKENVAVLQRELPPEGFPPDVYLVQGIYIGWRNDGLTFLWHTNRGEHAIVTAQDIPFNLIRKVYTDFFEAICRYLESFHVTLESLEEWLKPLTDEGDQ